MSLYLSHVHWQDTADLSSKTNLIPQFNLLTWSGWVSGSYCGLQPLWSGMGDVVPAHTSLILHPPSPPTVSHCIDCPAWFYCLFVSTLQVLNFWKFTTSSYCSLKPLRSGMGEVVPAHTSPTLHPPPSPPTVHQLSRLALQELTLQVLLITLCLVWSSVPAVYWCPYIMQYHDLLNSFDKSYNFYCPNLS